MLASNRGCCSTRQPIDWGRIHQLIGKTDALSIAKKAKNCVTRLIFFVY
jgi:hypothetical protein